MRATIDKAGRIVIPKDLRDRLGLTGGQEVDVIERDGVIEIEPTSAHIRLEQTPHGPVAVADREMPLLTDEIVRATLERVRR